MRVQENRVRFACECKGCRGYLPDIAGIVWPQQLADRVQGYYFSPSSMRVFNSRLGNWVRLTNPASTDGKRDGIAIVVSSRYDIPGAARYYEVIRICAWGAVHRQEGPDGLEKSDTSRAANKLLAAATYPDACECHGCILDREGRA